MIEFEFMLNTRPLFIPFFWFKNSIVVEQDLGISDKIEFKEKSFFIAYSSSGLLLLEHPTSPGLKKNFF